MSNETQADAMALGVRAFILERASMDRDARLSDLTTEEIEGLVHAVLATKALTNPAGQADGAGEVKLRSIVSHATGGQLQDASGSLNSICVEISRHHNRIWQHAQEAALRSTAPAVPSAPVDAGLVERLRADLEGNRGPLADAARRIATRLSDTSHGQASAYSRAKDDILAALTASEAALRARAEGVGDEWLPIETAPKDGKRFLAYDSKGDVSVVERDLGYWLLAGTAFPMIDLVRWRPLPDLPPQAKGDEQ